MLLLPEELGITPLYSLHQHLYSCSQVFRPYLTLCNHMYIPSVTIVLPIAPRERGRANFSHHHCLSNPQSLTHPPSCVGCQFPPAHSLHWLSPCAEPQTGPVGEFSPTYVNKMAVFFYYTQQCAGLPGLHRQQGSPRFCRVLTCGWPAGQWGKIYPQSTITCDIRWCHCHDDFTMQFCPKIEHHHGKLAMQWYIF